MMGIPKEQLTEVINIEPYLGNTAYGATFGSPVTLLGYVEFGFKKVVDNKGEEVIANALFFLPADYAPKTQDVLVYAGNDYQIIDCQPILTSGKVHHYEVYAKSMTLDV
mgnify:CR=1 FL=1